MPQVQDRSSMDSSFNGDSEKVSPDGRRAQAVVMTCLCACIFVSAIDITIITTALPAIVESFQSVFAYQWIGSSYVLAGTASTPLWGRMSDIWGRRPLILLAVSFFFTGSLICALALDVKILLIGRAVQGIGACGMSTMVNICICDMFPLRERSLYFGLTSAVQGIASAIGPVLGGVLSQKLTWRWCFWINIPLTAIVFGLLYYFLQLKHHGLSTASALKTVDWPGSLLIVCATLAVLLGINLGGVTYPWGSLIVVSLIVLGCVLYVLFVVNELKFAQEPVIPLRLFHAKSSILSFIVCFCHAFVFLGIAYYLPLYFQAALGADSLQSGIYLLSFIFPMMITAAFTGVYIQRTNQYTGPLRFGLPLMALGTALFINFDSIINLAKIIIFPLMAAIGIGVNFSGPLLAVQSRVPAEDVATATATFGFVRQLAMAISTVVGGVVAVNSLVIELADDIDPSVANKLRGADAFTNVRVISKLKPEQQASVRNNFSEALQSMWIMYAAFAVIGMIVGLFIKGRLLGSKEDSRYQEVGYEEVGLEDWTEQEEETRIRTHSA